ncbi:hypothetical protein SK128_009691 [Halocaridina rubra]|uniref:BZIP domain-containing protein n=1 Tax=Halocaridina rubra TaxID=373956 RepID=A0AAN8XJ21_HALRR
MSTFGGARKKTTNQQTHQQQTDLFSAVLPSTEMCPPGEQCDTLGLNIASQYDNLFGCTDYDDLFATGVVNPSEQLKTFDDVGNLSLQDPCEAFSYNGEELLNLDESYLDILDSLDYRQDGYSLTYDGGISNVFSSELLPASQQQDPFCQETLPSLDNFSRDFSLDHIHLPYPSVDQYYPSCSELHASDDATTSNLFNLSNDEQNLAAVSEVVPLTSNTHIPPEIDLPNSSSDEPSSSQRGHKHRHKRVYGLSEVDQTRRNQRLNNEASQLYRERRKLKLQELESDVQYQEKRKRELQRQYKMILKLTGKFQEKLNI